MSTARLPTKCVACILFLLLVLPSCTGLVGRPEPPIVSLSNLEMGQAGLFEQSFILTLRLRNPNDFALPLRGLSYELKLGGQAFARGVSNDRVSIEPYEEALVKVNLTTSLLRVFKQLKSLTMAEGKPLAYSIEGKIGLMNSNFRLPFSQAGELSLK